MCWEVTRPVSTGVRQGSLEIRTLSNLSLPVWICLPEQNSVQLFRWISEQEGVVGTAKFVASWSKVRVAWGPRDWELVSEKRAVLGRNMPFTCEAWVSSRELGPDFSIKGDSSLELMITHYQLTPQETFCWPRGLLTNCLPLLWPPLSPTTLLSFPQLTHNWGPRPISVTMNTSANSEGRD